MKDGDNGKAPETLEPAVAAMIFAADDPVHPEEIARALGGVELPRVEEAVRAIEQHFEHHDIGLQLERVAGGLRFATRPSVGAWVRRFFRERNRTRLSLPALETLAIVAYRQPITGPEIQAIRGKDPGAALKNLLEKKLLRCLGRKKVVGSPLLYGTTRDFLLHFGLDSLEDLPAVEDFEQVLDMLGASAAAPAELHEEPVETRHAAPDLAES
jgi:segregation and condensation protein B